MTYFPHPFFLPKIISVEQRQTIMQEEDKWSEREETKETEVEKQLTLRAVFITLV
jgi:hypothetical protein